jgi:hypothetical protein
VVAQDLVQLCQGFITENKIASKTLPHLSTHGIIYTA